jgi:hypothetical protein
MCIVYAVQLEAESFLEKLKVTQLVKKFPDFHGTGRFIAVYTRAHHWSLLLKVKLSLCLTEHHAMQAYWGSGGIAPRILDLGTRWK